MKPVSLQTIPVPRQLRFCTVGYPMRQGLLPGGGYLYMPDSAEIKLPMPDFFDCVLHESGYLVTQIHEWSELEDRLANLVMVAAGQERVLLFRGQERLDWPIASTFCRSLWRNHSLYTLNPAIIDEPEGYHRGLLALTSKFFKQIKPSREVWAAVAEHPRLDPYFEVMRHCQHYPETDIVEPLGTNIIDCSTNWLMGCFFAAGGYEDIAHSHVDAALWILDATAMGKVLVKDRPLMMIFKDAAEKDGTEAVLPYIHCPGQQRYIPRASVQDSYYLAQFDFRWPLENIIGIQARKGVEEPCLLKICIPASEKRHILDRLLSKGINYDFVLPP